MRNLETAPYITVHGPDGAGKTTVGRRVVGMLQQHGHEAVFFDDWRDQTGWTNPFSNKEVRRQVGESGKAFTVLQSAKAAMDSVAINGLTDSGIVVVKDRGIIDVRADLNYRGLDPSDCQSPLIREPDLAVYLHVGEAARHRRLAVKEDVHPEDFQPNSPGHRLYAMTQFVMAAVTDLAPEHGVVLQTDDLSADQVVEQVHAAVSEIICR